MAQQEEKAQKVDLALLDLQDQLVLEGHKELMEREVSPETLVLMGQEEKRGTLDQRDRVEKQGDQVPLVLLVNRVSVV